MRKVCVWVAGCLVFALGLTLPTSAAAVEQCWQVAPFIDVIRAEVTPLGNHFLVNGTESAAGIYFLQLVGSASFADDQVELTFHTGKDGAFGGGDDSCVWEATIDPATISGPITVRCGNFFNAGTLVPVSCAGAAAAVPGAGAIGQ
jgi:hypothetical protein